MNDLVIFRYTEKTPSDFVYQAFLNLKKAVPNKTVVAIPYDRAFFRDSLIEIQERDKNKNEYCIEHNIPLVRIPYWKLETLKISDLFEKKYEVEL